MSIKLEENNEQWIGIEELSDYLGVSIETIRSWLRNNSDIPIYKVGKLWRCKKSEIDKWVRENDRKSEK